MNSAQFSTGCILIILPQHGHKRRVVALNFRVCAGIKGKQGQSSALPHCVNAYAKVLAGIRWAQKHQVLAVYPPVSLVEKRMREYSLNA